MGSSVTPLETPILAFPVKHSWANRGPEWLVIHPAGYVVAQFAEHEQQLARWDSEHRQERAEDTCKHWGIPPKEFVATAAKRYDAFLLAMTDGPTS